MATYGELIELLHVAELRYVEEDVELSELVVTLFKKRYPSIYIGRPSRFLDTLRRIALPTRPHVVGKQLNGDSLRSYLKQIWSPKIRNPPPTGLLFNHNILCYAYSIKVVVLVVSKC